MDSKNAERSNKTGSKEKQTQDEPIIKIYHKDNQLTWAWRGIDGIIAEEIFLKCYNTQMRRNIKREILTEINNNKKIIVPNGMIL